MNYNGADTLIAFGGACKSLPQRGPGWFSGLGVIYSSKDDTDLEGEYFTKQTRFGLRPGNEVITFYRHGQNPKVGRRQLTFARFSEEAEGIRFTGQLNMKDPFQQRIDRLIGKNKMGLSTGSMGHLVVKEPRGNAFELVSWIIGELSLTPTPCEVRTRQGLVSLKSLMADYEPTEAEMDQWEMEEEAIADAYMQRVAPKSYNHDAEQKAREIYVELIKSRYEAVMQDFERSQHGDAKAEEYDYYNALAQIEIRKCELRRLQLEKMKR